MPRTAITLSLCFLILSSGACNDRPARKPAARVVTPTLPIAKPAEVVVDPCEALVGGMPLDHGSSISWGTARKPCATPDECVEAGAVAVANIDEVLVECIPIGHSSDAFERNNYEIAVTATITNRIKNDAGNFCDEVVFEARTLAGVVLGSASEKFCLIHGKGVTATASAKISPLSGEEIRRVAVVTARWKYAPVTFHRVK